VSGFRVKFVDVCEWFDGCDILKVIFKSKKQKQDYKIVFYFKNN